MDILHIFLSPQKQFPLKTTSLEKNPASVKLWSTYIRRSQQPTNHVSSLLSLFSPPSPFISPLSFLFFLHPPLILLPLLVPLPPRYAKLHLHPLRSRVRDMEHKLKVAMDNLVRGVKVAASSRPPPGEEGREGIKEEPKLLVTNLQNVYT